MNYEDCKIYGPYISRQDNRLRIVVVKNGSKTTLSYPKYLMELHLGRYLTEDETVDHIDCNVQNNEIPNLRLLSRAEHAAVDAKRCVSQLFKCPMCNGNFSLDGRKLSDAISNRKRSKAGPFCCKSCCGRYGKQVQLGSDLLEVKAVIPSYTTLKADKSPHEETYEVDIAKTVNA